MSVVKLLQVCHATTTTSYAWHILVPYRQSLIPAVLQDVALVLKSLGLPFELELECTQTDYTIDIALPDVKLAIEVDGPLHFMRNAPKATGRTLGESPLT